jgi:nicotinate phosphoribosyltransferase
VLKGIRLDSGNILKLSKLARKMLDEAGMRDVRILASGDLDEYKIDRFVRAGAPINDFGVGTKMGASVDAPSLDVIYKIAEVTNEEGIFIPTMKLSEQKATVPGRKQVFRVRDKKGLYLRDIVGLENEALGEPMLKQVMQAGEILIPNQSAALLRDTAQKNLGFLKKRVKSLHDPANYQVQKSQGLTELIKVLSWEIKKRQFRTVKKP